MNPMRIMFPMNKHNMQETLFNRYVFGDKISIFAGYLSKNKINDKMWVNPVVFVIINLCVSYLIYDVSVNYESINKDKYAFCYIYFLILFLLSIEIVTLVRFLIQLFKMKYEILHNSPKHNYIIKIHDFFACVFIMAMFGISLRDLDFKDDANSNYNVALRKSCIGGILFVFCGYYYYIKKCEGTIKMKFIDGDENIKEKYIECVINIIKINNINDAIKGTFTTYSNINVANANAQENTCTICIDTINQTDIVFNSDCDHVYHQNCIIEWFLHNTTCPICRTVLI